MHKPVLLNEVLEYLDPKQGCKLIDATVGGGGHARSILERVVPKGKLLGIELDGELLEKARSTIYGFESNAILVNDSYVNLKKIAEKNNFIGADGVLFDLGMSSWHLESSGRGFTFQKDEPLDMRFDSKWSAAGKERRERTAAEIVNDYSYDELAEILKEYGEERFAKKIAAAIIKERKNAPIGSTFQLIEIIKNSVPFWYRRSRIHFATRTFQALRIEVNGELENLKAGLEAALEILKEGGRLAVISFHSLEDRIVKWFLRSKKNDGAVRILTPKPVMAGEEEIESNPRARSAKLRAGAKLTNLTNNVF